MKLIGTIALIGVFVLLFVHWLAGLLVLILAQLMVMGRQREGRDARLRGPDRWDRRRGDRRDPGADHR